MGFLDTLLPSFFKTLAKGASSTAEQQINTRVYAEETIASHKLKIGVPTDKDCFALLYAAGTRDPGVRFSNIPLDSRVRVFSGALRYAWESLDTPEVSPSEAAVTCAVVTEMMTSGKISETIDALGDKGLMVGKVERLIKINEASGVTLGPQDIARLLPGVVERLMARKEILVFALRGDSNNAEGATALALEQTIARASVIGMADLAISDYSLGLLDSTMDLWGKMIKLIGDKGLSLSRSALRKVSGPTRNGEIVRIVNCAKELAIVKSVSTLPLASKVPEYFWFNDHDVARLFLA